MKRITGIAILGAAVVAAAATAQTPGQGPPEGRRGQGFGAVVEYLERKAAAEKPDMKAAYEDVLWTMINTKEFLFNH